VSNDMSDLLKTKEILLVERILGYLEENKGKKMYLTDLRVGSKTNAGTLKKWLYIIHIIQSMPKVHTEKTSPGRRIVWIE